MEFWINNSNGLKLNQYGIKMNKAVEISKNLMCSINYVTADKIAYGKFNLRRQESWKRFSNPPAIAGICIEIIL